MTFSTQLQRKLVCNDVRGVILPLLNLLQHQVHIQGGGALAYFQGNVFGEKVSEGEAIIFIAVHARQGHRSGLSNALGGGPDGGFRRSCGTGCILRSCRTRNVRRTREMGSRPGRLSSGFSRPFRLLPQFPWSHGLKYTRRTIPLQDRAPGASPIRIWPWR